MIEIENVSVYGFEEAIRGMRNPMNSWDKSDSYTHYFTDEIVIGNNDLDLMKRLIKSGTDHRKFMRMIVVYADIIAPLYWWKEFDTYKVGTVRNSCSTMHKITEKEFTLDDFSHEHMTSHNNALLRDIVGDLNAYRNRYISSKETDGMKPKNWWWQIIQLLPSSYNQRATLMLNYEVLANIYHSRKNHKLDEWRDFCKWIETLPYSELITGGDV